MSNPVIAVVVPTNRPERMAEFRHAWGPLLRCHKALLVTVYDGEDPQLTLQEAGNPELPLGRVTQDELKARYKGLICRRTDAVRNLGFALVADMPNVTHILTLDDDVRPRLVAGDETDDPIAAHLSVMGRRVPISWMNTAHKTDLYLRGMPYGVRDEAEVVVSHGVWEGVPDFDGETQLMLEESKEGIPKTLPYYVGPVPHGCMFPVCGMNLMFARKVLPWVYFAPMGPDSGVPGLNRFADIWMGIFLKRRMDKENWAIYTGKSVIQHDRASDARKNIEQEIVGREWNEYLGDGLLARGGEMFEYLKRHSDMRDRWYKLITSAGTPPTPPRT